MSAEVKAKVVKLSGAFGKLVVRQLLAVVIRAVLHMEFAP